MKRYLYLGTIVLLVLIINVHRTNGQSPSTSQNYVMETTVKQTGYSTEASLSSLPVGTVSRKISYFDGLGRPMQVVDWKASPDEYDLVSVFTYDYLGRPLNTYLPYKAGTADASFKTSADGAAVTYYSGSHAGVVQTSYPFSRPVYEPAPLNRVLEQGAPGAVWQPLSGSIAGSGHTQKMEYLLNTASDTVKLWTVSGTTVSTSGNYAGGQLTRTVSKDENWTSGNAGTVDEYKDVEGRVVCKRVWETNTVARSTHYVYDARGLLRYVIPPKVTATSLTEDVTADFINLVYAYHYDALNRLIEKKVPGKGWEYMVYNVLDQVVLSQDAGQRDSTQWLYNKYDYVGRLIITGRYSNGSGRSTLQSAVDGDIPGNSLWEVRGSGSDYGNNAYPRTGTSVLTMMYYDDYDFPGASTYSYAFASMLTGGLQTGSKVNVLGTSDMLLNVQYYNNDGQLEQSMKEHYLAGSINTGNYDDIGYTYGFSGELLSVNRVHRTTGGNTKIRSRYEYDHMGRKVKTYQKMNTDTEVLLSELVYNEIGQLKDQEYHDGLHTNSYLYNERGWLTESSSPLFEMQLKYTNGTVAQYNGNIADQLWGTPGSLTKSYAYSYDALNRLTQGLSNGTKHEKNITYDPMGNILTLTRDNGTAQSYSYTGNKLNSVSGGLSRSYTYDSNGSALTTGVVTYTYNILNLPATANGAVYTYDATGRKLRRVLDSVTTHYIDGVQYTGNVIDFVQTEVGLARKGVGSSYTYEYNLTDHLGNNRLSFDIYSNAPREIQADDYYPFGKRIGMTAPFGAENKYLYNGKELQDGLGAATYDYGARFYDAEVGRWNAVDPMAEKYSVISPYLYALNNPIALVDFDGKDVDPSRLEDEKHKRALIAFLRTNLGKAFVKDYMKKGDSFTISLGKEKYVYTNSGQSGKFSNDILAFGSANELGFNQKTFVAGVTTIKKTDGNSLMENEYGQKAVYDPKEKVVAQIWLLKGLDEVESIGTLGHESFVHAANAMNKLGELRKQLNDGTIRPGTKEYEAKLKLLNGKNDHQQLGDGKVRDYKNLMLQMDVLKNSSKFIKFYNDDVKAHK